MKMMNPILQEEFDGGRVVVDGEAALGRHRINAEGGSLRGRQEDVGQVGHCRRRWRTRLGLGVRIRLPVEQVNRHAIVM